MPDALKTKVEALGAYYFLIGDKLARAGIGGDDWVGTSDLAF